MFLMKHWRVGVFCLLVCFWNIECYQEIEFVEKERCSKLSQTNYTELTREGLLVNLLICSSKYDPKIPPTYDEHYATNVTVQLYILSIYSIDETNMDFSVDMFLRQSWSDPRLQFKHTEINKLELDSKMMQHVWVPDTFFVDEKEASFHLVTVPNKLMFIHRNGTVQYSIRISMTISCYMELLKFPLDKQICPIKMESYGYTTENLILKWKKPIPVIIPDYIGLPQFSLSDIPTFRENGIFSCLVTDLHLQRNRGFYIVQIFVPSILIVILSWVSFWIDIEAVPARISLGLLTVLTMTTHSSGIQSMLPSVSYVKAIDIWMATCITFVFGSLLEYAYINVMSRRMKPVKGPISPTTVILKEVATPILMYRNYRDRARKADKFARVAFPLAFILFNIFFWTFFLYIP